jgi:hypothetical protein
MSILLKRNSVSGTAPLPSELVPGEIAINTADAALYTKNENGEVVALASASDLPLPTTISWDNITGKPSFELQSHEHQPSDIVGTAVITTDPRLSDSRDPLPHNHNILNVDGLQDALDAKSNTGHTHDNRYYTETESNNLLANKANLVHNHNLSDIINLQPTLSGIESSISTINGDITDLESGKQDAGDYALNSSLNNYSLTTHDHSYPNWTTKIGFEAGLNIPTELNIDGVSSRGNTSIGYQSCKENILGYGNTGVGNLTLFKNTNGYYNCAVGSLSMIENTIGNYNTAIGGSSLRNQTTSISNTGCGIASLFSTTTGSYNTALGSNALDLNTVGSNNVAIGYSASANNSNYNNCIIIGSNARALRTGDFVLGSSSNPVVVSTSVGSTGAAASLPTNPLGYLEVRLNGILVKIPYYRN